MKTRVSLWKDIRGDAVVEATILFPIIIMIFAGLVLLAMYLPTRAVLQRATQYAATAIATERSDTWLRHDSETLTYYWETDRGSLGNVYASLIKALAGSGRDEADEARQTVIHMEKRGPFQPAGDLTVEFQAVNYIVYKEVVVTATRTIPMPVDLSFVRFPKEIPITVTSTAVVQNGDEFVRNMDLAASVADQLGVSEMFGNLKKLGGKITGFLGI